MKEKEDRLQMDRSCWLFRDGEISLIDGDALTNLAILCLNKAHVPLATRYMKLRDC
jgi:hypothetical protein